MPYAFSKKINVKTWKFQYEMENMKIMTFKKI